MAVVEISQRGQVPQGRVTFPAGENTFAEQFGGALIDLGETAGRVAGQVAEANRIEEEKAWERLQPEIARDLAQAGLDWTEAYADMKEKAPEDLAGFQDQVKAWGDNRRDELLKKFPGQKAADYIDVHFADLIQQYGSTAIVDSTDAKYRVIGNSMQSALDKTANNIALNPKQYDLGRKSMLDMIDTANVSESYKTEWRARVEQSLSMALIGGRLNDGDAKGARDLLDSGGAFNRYADESNDLQRGFKQVGKDGKVHIPDGHHQSVIDIEVKADTDSGREKGSKQGDRYKENLGRETVGLLYGFKPEHWEKIAILNERLAKEWQKPGPKELWAKMQAERQAKREAKMAQRKAEIAGEKNRKKAEKEAEKIKRKAERAAENARRVAEKEAEKARKKEAKTRRTSEGEAARTNVKAGPSTAGPKTKRSEKSKTTTAPESDQIHARGESTDQHSPPSCSCP